MAIFSDRAGAGLALSEALGKYKGEDVVILALPRGGVPVAVEVSKALHAPIDLIIARKIGHPFQREYAIGAVSEDGFEIYNEAERQRVDPEWLQEEVQRQLAEAHRRRQLYMGGRTPIDLANKVAILIDDGIATGYTMRAAIHSVVSRSPKLLVVAVPVAPEGTPDRIDGKVDEFVILETPGDFHAIGAYYDDFGQVSDEEVARLMAPGVSA